MVFFNHHITSNLKCCCKMSLIIKSGEAGFTKYMNLDCILIIKTHTKKIISGIPDFKLFFFNLDQFKKNFYWICYNTACVLFFFFGHEAPGIIALLTRDQTHTLCIGRRGLNHWTVREVPESPIISKWLPFTSAISSVVFPTLILHCQYFKN